MNTAREEITIEIGMIPPSLNDAFIVGRNGRRFPSHKLVEWREFVGDTVNQLQIANSLWYGMEIVYTFPLFFKNGNVRIKDVSNLNKYAEDESLKKVVDQDGRHIDDSRILELNSCKTNGQKESTCVTLYCIGEI